MSKLYIRFIGKYSTFGVFWLVITVVSHYTFDSLDSVLLALAGCVMLTMLVVLYIICVQ